MIKDGKPKLFKDWCRLDTEDKRKIHYELLRYGKTEQFTSEDLVAPDIMKYLGSEAVIVSKKLRDNEWFIKLR